jgi:hypothetical protein
LVPHWFNSITRSDTPDVTHNEDAALLRFLKTGESTEPEDDEVDRLRQRLLADLDEPEHLDRDAALRQLGLSPRERRTVLQPDRTPRPASSYRSTQLKRFRHYIDQRVDWNHTELHPDQVVGVWAHLTDFNIERAVAWWSAGVSPVELDLIEALSDEGLQPRDLATLINGKPIRWHISRGSSLQWCLSALGWNQRHTAG